MTCAGIWPTGSTLALGWRSLESSSPESADLVPEAEEQVLVLECHLADGHVRRLPYDGGREWIALAADAWYAQRERARLRTRLQQLGQVSILTPASAEAPAWLKGEGR